MIVLLLLLDNANENGIRTATNQNNKKKNKMMTVDKYMLKIKWI